MQNGTQSARLRERERASATTRAKANALRERAFKVKAVAPPDLSDYATVPSLAGYATLADLAQAKAEAIAAIPTNQFLGDYALANLPAANTAAEKFAWGIDLGGGPGLLQSNGSGWRRVTPTGIESLAVGALTATRTLGALTNGAVVRLTGTAALSTAFTLSTTGAADGERKTVVNRAVMGAFAFTVNGLTLVSETELTFEFAGGTWYLLDSAAKRTLRSNLNAMAKTSTAYSTVILGPTLEAGKTYWFRFVGDYTADATGGQKWNISGTATGSLIRCLVKSLSTGGTGVGTPVILGELSVLGGTGLGHAGATSGRCEIEGVITVVTAGTLNIQFAQNANGGTSNLLARGTLQIDELA